MASTASYTAPWTMAKLMIATGGGCLATPTIAVEAASFQSVTVSARAGAAVAASAATASEMPIRAWRVRPWPVPRLICVCMGDTVAGVANRPPTARQPRDIDRAYSRRTREVGHAGVRDPAGGPAGAGGGDRDAALVAA